MVRSMAISLRSPEPSRASSKRRHGYFQSLNYASLFNARRTGLVSPSDVTPASKGSKKTRRRFICFNDKRSDTSISENDSKSQGEASVGTKIACHGSDAQMADLVAALDIQSQPPKRAKSSDSVDEKLNGKESTLSNGSDEEECAGENMLEEGEVIMKDGQVICHSVGCMPAVRVLPRMFGREIGNRKGFKFSSAASSEGNLLLHGADEESVHKASRKETTEADIADIDDDSVDSDPIPSALETRFSDVNKDQEDAENVSAGGDDERVKVALAAFESGQTKVVQQLQREVSRLEEACALNEERAAAAERRKAQVTPSCWYPQQTHE